MMLNREEALKTVVDGISWIAAQAKLRGTIHLFDSNIVVQEVFRQLLNEMHDLQLIGTDNIHQNFPAIDLGDEMKKRAFQVTAETKSEKIQATIDAYVAHDFAPRFGKLQVIVIGDRQKSYKKLVIPPAMAFKWEEDIIDAKRFIQQIHVLGTEKLGRVAEVIRKEIGLRSKQPASDTRPLQSSKIASCYLPIRLPKQTERDDVDPVALEWFSDFLHQSLSRCFGHTCVTTGIEDFVFLLTVDRSDRKAEPGFVPLDFALVCHITEFVRTIEERLAFFVEGRIKTLPALKALRGDQTLQIKSRFGSDMPHRIHRQPPSGISIEHIDIIPSPPSKTVTTSKLLCLLAAAFKKKVLIWDDAETYPDLAKVMTMFDRTDRAGFTWDGIKLDSTDPERWEYVG